MRLRWANWMDRLASSLFFEPMVFVFLAIGLAFFTLWVDDHLDLASADLPLGLASTVESARSVLSTVASATMTVAGIAFSVALLVMQLTASQHSPRVVQGLFRESFNKHVMGLVVGTFTYCLVVLRSVHSALEPGGEPVIPNVSVAVGVVLGIASLLAIVAFISHNAHKMDVSEILAGVASQTVDKLVESWPEPGTSPDAPATSGLDRAQPFTTFAVRFERSGWIQYVDRDRMRRAVPDGTLVRLLCTAGQYATAGAPLCTLSPEPTGEASDIVSGICAAVQVGAARTIVQDPSYGIRQLADVALKALSPGVNDPTTAQDAVFHLGGVLAEAYRRDPPPMSSADDRGRVIIDTVPVGHAELTALAFSEIRLCGVSQPQVAIYLLETMATLLATLDPARGFDARRALVREAQLVLAGTEREALLPEDIDRVRAVYVRHFGADASGRSGATISGNRTDG